MSSGIPRRHTSSSSTVRTSSLSLMTSWGTCRPTAGIHRQPAGAPCRRCLAPPPAPSAARGIDRYEIEAQHAAKRPAMHGMCLCGARNEMEADSTSGAAATNAARLGHAAMLRGNSAPYAFRINIRQSRRSLAEIAVCSRIISWKRGTRCICCATTTASSRMLCQAPKNFEPRERPLRYRARADRRCACLKFV